ncbi:glycoside hydrolase family 15 protein [Actinomadura sp. 9N407]|uniref:glycoside hydrolase family 15 protein n=1 Tax=Actinomadura sp. 9N407 TaxID=3375154 RepID=UPI0037A6DF06
MADDLAGDRIGSRAGGTFRTVRRITALLLVATLVATCGATLPDLGKPGWGGAGLIGGGGWPFAGDPVSREDAAGASYIPGSSVVRLKNGRVQLVPFGAETAITVNADDPRVAAAVRSDQAWLARGTVPSGGPTVPDGNRLVYQEMASRALLDLRLLTRPNGASQASWYGAWRYSWPRDSAFTAAAFVATGHYAEARRVLRFLSRVQHENGQWAARYHPDGTAVTDGREAQLDSLGWVMWAAWFFHAQAPEAAAELPELWPMVERAANHLTRSLDVEGLPPPSSDYWERDPDTEEDPRRPTLGVVGPALAGLRSAASFALGNGHTKKAHDWQKASNRVSKAVAQQFAPYGYPRSPIEDGLMDTSVTFIAPPFAPLDAGVTAAIADAAVRQSLPNGGVLPGERWSGDPNTAWTPEVALFALSAAASGRTGEAVNRLDWLAAHRTSLGALPEKVDEDGDPSSVAPLGWTASLVLLTLAALESPLPLPRVR